MVGFQTHLRWPEQKRVFRMIPGLEEAEFIRYGVMHKNSYLNSPLLLDADYSLRSHPHLYFAGQMTGVEGYVESAASGLAAGIYLSEPFLERQSFFPQGNGHWCPISLHQQSRSQAFPAHEYSILDSLPRGTVHVSVVKREESRHRDESTGYFWKIIKICCTINLYVLV